MSQDYLGEFEHMVLLSVMRLGSEAYGLAIKDELESVAGRSPSSGALYTTLDRMERKGLLEFRAGEPSGEVSSGYRAEGDRDPACPAPLRGRRQPVRPPLESTRPGVRL